MTPLRTKCSSSQTGTPVALVMMLSLIFLQLHESNASASMHFSRRTQRSFLNPLRTVRGGDSIVESAVSSVTPNDDSKAPNLVHGSSNTDTDLSPSAVQLTSATTMKSASTSSATGTSSAPKKKKRKKSSTSSSTLSTSTSPPSTVVNTSSAIPDPIKKYAVDAVRDGNFNQMPTIFNRPEEAQYDTYAACLAATESLRRLRDSAIGKIKKSSSAVNADDNDTSWKSYLSKDGSQEDGSQTGKDKEILKRAYAEYVLNSSKAINALGLSVTQFNQLGREIRKDKELKEKVMEQAYLYRMASAVKMDKMPLIQDPDSKQLLKSTRRRRLQMFVKSITEIEELRTEQMARLNKALNIDKIPSNVNLCDPNVLPLLDSKVRSVIEAFPLQAEAIVKKYGLNSDEFNQMLEETKGNPVFRWRVQKIKRMEDMTHKKDKDDGIFESMSN